MPHLATRTTVLCTAVALAAAGTALLAGCSAASDGGTGPTATASAHASAGVLGTGFSDPDQPPAPEATIHPEPGSVVRGARPRRLRRRAALRRG